MGEDRSLEDELDGFALLEERLGMRLHEVFKKRRCVGRILLLPVGGERPDDVIAESVLSDKHVNLADFIKPFLKGGLDELPAHRIESFFRNVLAAAFVAANLHQTLFHFVRGNAEIQTLDLIAVDLQPLNHLCAAALGEIRPIVHKVRMRVQHFIQTLVHGVLCPEVELLEALVVGEPRFVAKLEQLTIRGNDRQAAEFSVALDVMGFAHVRGSDQKEADGFHSAFRLQKLMVDVLFVMVRMRIGRRGAACGR